MKRTLAILLAVAMLLCSFSFASAEGEKVKLTGLFISHALTKSVYDMNWLMEIEEAAGVDVEWEQIYTDWNQVKTTRFAAGDIPDILINATGDSDGAGRDAPQPPLIVERDVRLAAAVVAGEERYPPCL